MRQARCLFILGGQSHRMSKTSSEEPTMLSETWNQEAKWEVETIKNTSGSPRRIATLCHTQGKGHRDVRFRVEEFTSSNGAAPSHVAVQSEGSRPRHAK